jgi:hypothetical protein
MIFVMEKGVPVPPKKDTSPTGLKAAIMSMEVGDSFFYPSTSKQPYVNMHQVTSRLYDRKYTCRKVEGGARIWRIS